MKKISNSGFTLIELLVVILLLTVVAVISSDMIINLTSTSAKVQNKISVEEEYSFLNAKLSKLIQDADNVSVQGNFLKIFYPNNKIYILEFDQSSSTLKLDGLQLTQAEIGKTGTGSDFFVSVTGTNPTLVTISFTISKDFGNPRLFANTKFERRITLNKTYNNN